MFCTGPTHSSTHNISKTQLMNMCGFGSTIDLGKTHFNFSWKNYSSKVYTSFAKVVGLVTKSTTKLVWQFLDFSTILYEFYKLQPKHSKGLRIFLREDPWKVLTFTDLPSVYAQVPGKNQDLAMWSLGALAGAVRRIPARSPAVLAGGVAGEGLGSA
jgi:hypothetical protein